jgi:hypothetical protein
MPNMTIALLPFTTPNFVIGRFAARPRQEGITEGPKWPLSEIDADALSALCDEFRAEIFRKAGKADPNALPSEPRSPREAARPTRRSRAEDFYARTHDGFSAVLPYRIDRSRVISWTVPERTHGG